VRKLLVLRPEPAAAATAARAAAAGLETVIAPLFTIRPLDWPPADPADHDAVLITSANAARAVEGKLAQLDTLPAYVTGEATGIAVRRAGFRDVRVGDADGAAALALARDDGRERILHLCGRDHREFDEIEHRLVYAADAVDALPEAAREAIADGAVVLLHSPRAAGLFASFVAERGDIPIAAISPATAKAAGTGWAAVAVAARPRDEALLEVAAKLCQNTPPDRAEAGR
jgi:uroporphyrinogen-III synthase